MRAVRLESVPVNRELHRFPRVVILELVAGCNLACVMCPEKMMTRPKGIMNMALYRRLIDEIAAADPNTEIWAPIMGEVFMYRDRVFDYIGYAKAKGLMNVNLNTNLVLFQSGWIERLAESGLDRMVIGMDAATEDTYRKIRVDANPRRTANFLRVEENIQALLAARADARLPNLEIVLQFIVQKENAHEEEAFRRRWEGSGLVLKIRHKLGWGAAVPSEALDLSPEERVMPCPWLMRTMSVHWTGQVAQCDAMWSGREYVGDLNHETIREVWLGELLYRRERHLQCDFDFEPCRSCNDWQCGRAEIVATAN